MADALSIIEKLEAELRPIRQKRFADLRKQVLGGEDEVRDLICDDCLKYYEGNCNREFSPECDLTTDVQIRSKNNVLKHMTEDDQNQYWYLNDPVAWAKVEVDWDPRWYQIEPLRCSAKKKVFRMGRQIGKCLAPGTHIHMADGSRVPVEELASDPSVGQLHEVISLAGNHTKASHARVFKNKIKRCFKVRFASGRELTASYDHPFKAFDRWVEAEDLRIGDRIASERFGKFGVGEFNPEDAELLAYAIGDGGLTGKSFKFTNVNPTIRANICELAASRGCRLSWEDDLTCTVAYHKGKKNPIIEMLRHHGIFGKGAHTKFVPRAIQTAKKEVVALFLNRLFSTDGWASVSARGQSQIGYCSVSHVLIRDVQELLFKFGIFNTVEPKRIDGEVRAWQLFILDGPSIRKFADQIGILGKESALEKVVKYSKSANNNERSIDATLPKEVRNYVLRKLSGRSARSVLGDIRIGRDRGLSRRSALLIADKLDDDVLAGIAASEVLWDRVVSIEEAGDLQTYDLSISGADSYDDANFSAEGIFVHNTEVLSILALFYMATQPNAWVVILCPYQDQVDLVFKRIRKFIQKSSLLSNPDFKVKDKQNPHEIEFSHPGGNSWVLGMTAGVRTGQQGDKFRGQTPSLLIIDEGDMLDDKTLESVLASLTGAGPIAKMVVSSTPTGRRGMFWKYCKNKRMDFREFHYTSMVSPNWTPQLELFYRETYSENSFAHEFLAEFGEMEVGLFQHRFIEASLQDYTLHNAVPIPGEMYSFGVDWNREGIGVHILVSGFDFLTNKFRVAAKKIIDPGEFTQHKAIAEIAKMNDIWNPEFIYVDEGDGTTQVEALQLWGMSHPTTHLHRRVKGVDFGSKTLIRDPLTKQMVKKATKPLVVDLCVRQVERNNVILPKGEDNSNGLVGQMREFCIIRYSSEGQPVYSKEKDHTLIAWMLSVYAVIMEMTDIAKVEGSNRIAFTGPLGQGQTDLISQHKVREFRDRAKKLTPLPRTLDFVGPSSGFNRSSGPFLGYYAGNVVRGMRKKIGEDARTRPGHRGRPTWDRGGSRFGIPNDYD